MASENATTVLDTLHLPHIYRYMSHEHSLSTVSPSVAAALVFVAVLLTYVGILEPLFFGRLAHVPGPKFAGLSWYYLTYFDLKLCRQEKIGEWHRKYGPGQ